ncbi:hypothetical protein ACFT8V_33330 [Streptomyces griseoincarnatus]|uniref:hypothetical protein n=1 Tax=Streptomyces sp. I4(2020) TaxID=2760981 RepID=UPI0018EE5B31|nr:hypothetical protein [Streptomyces sp. I4(2020)]MBJ6613920.1 hypothetical protein [Streptomyces sp. I3(2020)]MBJ6630241.1 hypothetical protein [Streptomyces sp. I4(2020)]
MTIDLDTIVVLTLAGVAVYLAYKKPDLGGALLVGIAVITLLVLLLDGDQEKDGEQKACTAPASQPFQLGCLPPAGEQPSLGHTTPPHTPA